MVAHQKAVPFVFSRVDRVSYIFMPLIVKPMLTHVVCNASAYAWPVIKWSKSNMRSGMQVHAIPGLQNSSAQNHNIGSPISAAFALSRRPPAYVLSHLSASCSAVELQGVTVACRALESCTFEPLTAILNGMS